MTARRPQPDLAFAATILTLLVLEEGFPLATADLANRLGHKTVKGRDREYTRGYLAGDIRPVLARLEREHVIQRISIPGFSTHYWRA